jgi:predicted MPP superfamily phosphohydrolase
MSQFGYHFRRISHRLRGQAQIWLGQAMHASGRDRFRPEDFEVVPQTVVMAGMAPAFDGYRLVQISDLHVGHWLNTRRLQGVVGLVNELQPDLVAITGDFVSYALEPYAAEMIDAIAGLEARDGVVAVLGNHDHWLDPAGVRAVLQQSGVTELENEVLTVRRGQDALHIAGVGDITVGADRLDLVLSKLPEDGPAILLAHEPDFADVSAATGRFGLQLSGHSHGGQVVLPRIGPLVRGPEFRKYPIGRYQVGNMVQYTNRGIGTHVLRLRVNCEPEITLFNLRSPD